MRCTPSFEFGCWLVLAAAFCCPQLPAAELGRYERSEPQMGTRFTITLYATGEEQAQAGFQAAFERIQELDRALSDYRPGSEINRLSSTSPHAEPVRASRDAWRVLYRAQQISRISEGAFDVTLGPVTRLWRRARRRRELPDATRLAKAREATGYPFLRLDEATRSVQLLRPGMRLDLGGIAKGDALDQAMTELDQLGIRRALINGGGDVLAGDPPPGSDGWRVGLIGLADDRVTQSIRLSNRAAATSGDLWQYVQIDGTRYSHLVDPRTGLGLTERSTVTVTASRAIDADALASAISVLGPRDGMSLAGEQPGVGARIVFRKNGRVQVWERGQLDGNERSD